MFSSDQRFYDYYKLYPDAEKGESKRYTVLDGGLTLNTPIVIYSWKAVAEKLITEGIVTVGEDGVYYITDMNKLINYILEEKKWSDIGLNNIYGNIQICSALALLHEQTFHKLRKVIMARRTTMVLDDPLS